MNRTLGHERLLELAEEMQEAQSDLLDVIERLKQANRELKDEHARAYLLDQLEILASADHGFLSRDYNLSEWIDDVRELAEEAEEGESDEELEEHPPTSCELPRSEDRCE